MRDYRRAGFDLPKEQRQRVKELNSRLVELGTDFRKAIDTWEDAIWVTRDRLAGVLGVIVLVGVGAAALAFVLYELGHVINRTIEAFLD